MMILAKPKKPKKRIEVAKTARFDAFDFTCKKVSIKFFLDWLKKTTPRKAKDVTLELSEDMDYDYDGNLSNIWTHIELGWKEVIDNPDYEREMKKYEKKLKKFKEQ
jgi:hypothetical protein